MSPSICFVAAPLIARSGVYNSTLELVRAGRAVGHDWRALIGVSAGAGGAPTDDDGVTELSIEPGGVGGVRRLARILAENDRVATADVVIGLIPQTDMALAMTGLPWIAYLRGLPWPDAGESSRAKTVVWRSLEQLALSRALAVWATTPLLARQVGSSVDRIVTPGLVPPDFDAQDLGARFVWAARYSIDKHPDLFIDALRSDTTLVGAMYGSGPLEEMIADAAPSNVEVAGWVTREQVWRGARAYVGTSTREAFGRSAVEAAMIGIPVIVSDRFGCAPFLYTDPELRERFVLPIDDALAWTRAMQTMRDDDAMWSRARHHLLANAQTLGISAAVERVSAAAEDAITRPDARPSPST